MIHSTGRIISFAFIAAVLAGIGMSIRGEQFWLDQTMANKIRPRARPRYPSPRAWSSRATRPS